MTHKEVVVVPLDIGDRACVVVEKNPSDGPPAKRPRKEYPLPAFVSPPPLEHFQDDSQKKKGSVLDKLSQKLKGGQFRWLNEQLYTMPSEEADTMFKEKPSLFDTYHMGFREQISRWPANPLELIATALTPIYRNRDPPARILDLGCGEGRLASLLHREGIEVFSFDLKSASSHVIEADINKDVPFPSSTADAAVFSLALMGTNWPGAIAEAHRMLKPKGLLKIAEVTSRVSGNEKTFCNIIKAIGFENVKITATNTHFFMLDATRKHGATNPAPTDISATDILKPCEYRKR